MRPHNRLDAGARELAALHALDALSAEESAAYERHLTECSVCAREVASLRDAAAQLFVLAPQAAPPASLKDRLIERIRAGATGDAPVPAPVGPSVRSIREPEASRPSGMDVSSPPPAQPWRHWSSERPGSGHSLDRADGARWERTAFEGVETRRLFVDPAHDRVTMLVRMAAGASYPPHRHKGPEECYVIEGDLRAGSMDMRSGDFKFSGVNSEDVRQSTVNGCLLLIVSSMQDELLQDPITDRK